MTETIHTCGNFCSLCSEPFDESNPPNSRLFNTNTMTYENEFYCGRCTKLWQEVMDETLN